MYTSLFRLGTFIYFALSMKGKRCKSVTLISHQANGWIDELKALPRGGIHHFASMQIMEKEGMISMLSAAGMSGLA
jgi:hypothetical protein